MIVGGSINVYDDFGYWADLINLLCHSFSDWLLGSFFDLASGGLKK
jgi:hypothetical protein